METQPEQVWLDCQVFPGMFSNECIVEYQGRSYFVENTAVQKTKDNKGKVLVAIIEINGQKWGVMPTCNRETVPLGA